MKRLLLLCLFLAACQNQETNDRLARVAKKLDQIQQNPSVETIAVPSQPNPVPTTATEPMPFVNPPLSKRQIQISAWSTSVYDEALQPSSRKTVTRNSVSSMKT